MRAYVKHTRSKAGIDSLDSCSIPVSYHKTHSPIIQYTPNSPSPLFYRIGIPRKTIPSHASCTCGYPIPRSRAFIASCAPTSQHMPTK